MRTMKFFTYALLVLFLGVAISSCKGDDGADGIDGMDGATGPAGQDGNANVQTYIYNNPSWNTSGPGMFIDMEDILTTETIEFDVILVYIKHGTYVNPIPGLVWTGAWYRNYSVFFYDSNRTPPENLLIVSLEIDGNPTPNANLAAVEWVKVVIIESSDTTSTTGNGKSADHSKQEIYTELKNAGVDINDYKDVCDYYGINQ